MATVVFHVGDAVTELTVPDRTTVMRAAVSNDVPGIVGECGGQAMCATCHVMVRPEYLDRLPPMGEDEDEMLEETVVPRDPERSRLGCQLPLCGELSTLEVDVPLQRGR